MGYIQPTSEGNMGPLLEIIYGLCGEPQCRDFLEALGVY